MSPGPRYGNSGSCSSIPWCAIMCSNTFTLSGRFPGAAALPNHVVTSAADHLLQVIRRRGELQLLDLVEREPDPLELARHRTLALRVVQVDDHAVDHVRVALDERGELVLEHRGHAALKVFGRDTRSVMDDEIARHVPPAYRGRGSPIACALFRAALPA